MISIKNNKIRWGISALLALLILFGTYRNVFSLAAFLGCCLMIFFCDRESILLQLFFIMPMANIFKLAPGVQSFFTILILLYVVLHLVMPRKATTLIFLFAIYIVVGELFAGDFNLFRTIKLICNILFLSSILNDKVEIRHKEIFLSYIIGNVVASFFGMMDSGFFKIQSYIGEKGFGNPDHENYVARFSGLYTDPNYYAIGLIISLCLIVILFHIKKINSFLAVVISVPIVYFLIQTYSKSAILMLFLPLMILFYSLYRKRKYFILLSLMGIAIVVIFLALSGKIPALEIVLGRMGIGDNSSDMDINELTTGRFDLWVMYAEFLINKFEAVIFGVGIGTGLLNGFGSHNTYIDMIYCLGIFGTFLLVFSLKAVLMQRSNKLHNRNVLNYSIMLCIVIMYFFLGELFYFDPPFQISLAFMVLDFPLEENKNEKAEVLQL